ncbi:MAG: alkylhydroperoxidase [Pseudonocardiales bacterium]|nr:MAG: alkylhydroperoxidase [Pseudonocardiales bacterium]
MARAAWFFPVPAETALPERLQSLFAKARERIGFVPNVFRCYSYRPERFSAWFGHYQQLHEPTENLSVADREMIAVVVSSYNRCTYCIVSHGHALRVALDDQVTADYIVANWRHANLDERRYAICAFAEKLTARPNEMTEADLEQLASLGLSKDEVWDVIEVAAMYNFTNRMALATGQLPNEEYHHLDRPSG